jgi:hypothetical protein
MAQGRGIISKDSGNSHGGRFPFAGSGLSPEWIRKREMPGISIESKLPGPPGTRLKTQPARGGGQGALCCQRPPRRPAEDQQDFGPGGVNQQKPGVQETQCGLPAAALAEFDPILLRHQGVGA